MSDSNTPPPLGYMPDPLTPHRVVIEFDVLARSQEEADYIVNESLIEDLAGARRTDFAPMATGCSERTSAMSVQYPFVDSPTARSRQ